MYKEYYSRFSHHIDTTSLKHPYPRIQLNDKIDDINIIVSFSSVLTPPTLAAMSDRWRTGHVFL